MRHTVCVQLNTLERVVSLKFCRNGCGRNNYSKVSSHSIPNHKDKMN